MVGAPCIVYQKTDNECMMYPEVIEMILPSHIGWDFLFYQFNIHNSNQPLSKNMIHFFITIKINSVYSC